MEKDPEKVYIYVKPNIENERCEEEFCGANLKFMFSTEYTKSEKIIGELTEDLALFFIIFAIGSCCWVEYDIPLFVPLITNKETTYEEVIDKYINSTKIDDNSIKNIEHWNSYNNDKKIDINDIKLGLKNLPALIYILYGEYVLSHECHIIRINMEDALKINSNPGPCTFECSIDYETLRDKYSLSSKKE